MFKTMKPAVWLSAALLCLFIACQSNKEPQMTYPEGEIPVSTTSDEAMQEFLKGLELLDQGNAQSARPYFDKALELDPDFVSARWYRANSASSAKDFAENRDKFLAMGAKANEGEKLMIEMIEANMANDREKRKELITELVEKYPKSARALDMMAGYYNGNDETAKAREIWSKAIAINPDHLPTITNLGFSYLFTTPKDYTKAQKYMEMAVAKAPESSRAQINLGDCYRAQGNLNKALGSYLKAAELDPNDDVAFSKAGHANSFLGNLEAARKNYKDSRAVSEMGLAGYNFEANTYILEGDHEKALAHLKNAIEEIDQKDVPSSNKLWTIMGLTSDCAAIAMHQGDSEALKGYVEDMKPMSGQMIEEINASGFTMNQNANMHFWEAMTSAVAGNYEAAAETAELIKSDMEASDNPNKFRRYHRVHAYVNFQQGNFEKALEHMAELDPDDVYNKYWMARAYKNMGDEEKAMQLAEEIVNDNFNSTQYVLILNEAKEMLAASS
ncbi:tetratricopeptide repeat protein [Muriicola soli]|uniref:Tetratricopeptide repeat protein n=1 Tax=Muriicola soli TaxID=2507538 RepID=A0A411E694_9FLAO|nr:tetratricopeptide repeat protein [Muriicola soli]QBA63199.1 tetratricopeptide repeat protein [Muriicola soli]